MKVHFVFLKGLNRMLERRLCLFLVIFLLGSLAGFGQKDSLRHFSEDKSTVAPRYPKEASLEAFRNDRDYQYEEPPPEDGDVFYRWMRWLLRKVNQLFDSKAYNDYGQYVVMGLVALLILFLLYKAKVLEYLFPSPNTTTAYVVGQENIHEINFEEAIAQALLQQDYRLAIRLQYLKILKLLTLKELIHWKPNLTNQIYVEELGRTPLYEDFVRITRYFEFAWYGEFTVQEAGFKEMKTFSDSFIQKISR